MGNIPIVVREGFRHVVIVSGRRTYGLLTSMVDQERFDVIDSVISEISANIARCWREFPIASVCSCGPGFEAVSVVVALDEWSDDKVEELSGWGKCWWVTRWNAVSRAENKVTWKNSFECNYKTCHQVRSISVCPTYAMENIRQGILKMLIVKFNFQLNNIEIKL